MELNTLIYGLGAVTAVTILLIVLSLAILFLHRIWTEWYDGWMKADSGRLATFMRVAFEKDSVDIGETWMIDQNTKLKIVEAQ